MSYYIGRATNSEGPYTCIHGGSLNPGTYYDVHVQDEEEYFYKVLRVDADVYGYYPSTFVGPVSAVSVNDNAPDPIPDPDQDDGNYDVNTETVNMSWDPPNLGTNPDVAGYWVCPIFPDDPPRSLIIHASPIDRTTFRAPLPYGQYQGDEVIYYIAAMDYSGNIGPWSQPISIVVGTYIALSTSAEATASNNGQKFIRIVDTNELWLTYASDGFIYAAKSTDEGATWTIKQLGRGFYTAISCNSIAETPRPSVVWQFEDAGIHYIYFSRYLGNDGWTTAQMIQAGASGTTFGPPSFADRHLRYGSCRVCCDLGRISNRQVHEILPLQPDALDSSRCRHRPAPFNCLHEQHGQTANPCCLGKQIDNQFN
ncbi:MAG TPA: fibronectin type III domain-containing protein [bacterium]